MSEKSQGDIRSGVRLSFLSTAFAGLLQFAAMTVLARLLAPVEYGVFALCYAIASLAPIFINNVIERVLVVTANVDSECDETPTIALLCVVTTLLAMLVCFGINLVAVRQVDLGVLAGTCMSAIINAATISPRVSLRRVIRFGPIVAAETLGLVLGQVLTAILCALAGWGTYALVAAAIVQNGVALLMLRLYTYRQRAPFAIPTPRHVSALLRSATALGGNAATEIINGQISPLVLGTRLGAIALGLFNRSYSLVQMPIQLLVSSMSRVMISALFSVSGDRERLRNMARSLVRVAAVMATPVAAGIAGASHNFILFAFGAKWLAAQSIMPLLSIGAWGTMMGTLFGIIAEAMRAFGEKTRNQLISALLLVFLSFGGATYGLVGAVAGIAVSGCLFTFLFARLAAQVLGLTTLTVLGWLAPGLIVAAPCLLASMAAGHYLHGPSAAVFLTQIVACGFVDMVALLLLFPSLALQIVEGMAPSALRFVPPLARYLRRASRASAI